MDMRQVRFSGPSGGRTLFGMVAGALSLIPIVAGVPLTSEARPVSKRTAARLRHGGGKVTIGEHSGLRKLMRAANRGRVPESRLGVIADAMKSALARSAIYQHSQARNYLVPVAQALAEPEPIAPAVAEPPPPEPKPADDCAPTYSQTYSIRSNARRAAKARGIAVELVEAVAGGFRFPLYGLGRADA